MERKTARRFRPGAVDSVRRLRARRPRSARLPRRGGQVRGGRRHGGGLLDQLSPRFAEAAGRQARGRASRRSPSNSLAERLRQDARIPRAAGEGRRQAAGGPGGPREPRPEPAHRGRRAPPRARQLRGASPPTRCSRSAATRATRTRRASCSQSSIRRRRARTSSTAVSWLKARPETTAAGRGRLLLRRRHRQHAGDARARPRCRRCRSTASAPTLDDVPKIKAPLMIHFAETDDRINAGWPAYEAALKAAGVSTSATSTPAPSTGSTTTRRRATTPRPRSSPGSGRSPSSTSTCGRPRSCGGLRFASRVCLGHPAAAPVRAGPQSAEPRTYAGNSGSPSPQDGSARWAHIRATRNS